MKRRTALLAGLALLALDGVFARPSATAPRLPQAMDASRLLVAIASTTRYQRATNTVTYGYQLGSDRASNQPLAVFAIAVGSKVLSASGPRGWSGGAYHGRPLWSWAADDGDALVAPGGTLSGLALVSKGLPALQPAYLQGDTPVPSLADLPAGMTEVAFAQALDIVSNSRRDVVAAPGDFTTDAPLPEMVRFLQQQVRAAKAAHRLAGDAGLDAPLAAAERAARAGDLAGVRGQIKAFAAGLGAPARRPDQDGAAVALTIADVILARSERP